MALQNRVTLRLPQEVLAKYTVTAQKSDKTLSDVIRQALLKTNLKFNDKLTAKDRLEAIRLISKSSNNLNQIAKQLNSLALRNQLNYEESIHYLRILDTIEAQQHCFLRLFDVN